MCHADRLKKTSLDDAPDLSPDNDLSCTMSKPVSLAFPFIFHNDGMHKPSGAASFARGRGLSHVVVYLRQICEFADTLCCMRMLRAMGLRACRHYPSLSMYLCLPGIGAAYLVCI